MNQTLQKTFLAAEIVRNEIIALTKSAPQGQLSFRTSPNKWSVLQILTHLYISEQLSFSYIKKKSLGIDTLQDAGLKQTLLMPVLKISQRLPLRFKAPTVVVEHTPEPLPLNNLIDHWNLLRLELRSHLENISDKHVHRLVYKHPIAGRLSLPQALQFFAEHINHHRPQIIKALKVSSLT